MNSEENYHEDTIMFDQEMAKETFFERQKRYLEMDLMNYQARMDKHLKKMDSLGLSPEFMYHKGAYDVLEDVCISIQREVSALADVIEQEKADRG